MMAYRVLARKYRSRTFDEIVGQDAVSRTLTNAVSSGRIHHGYLFTGTRGVGKTSMARILAKALNCLGSEAPTTTPCGECESCRLVSEGEDIDVIEIDAASNTGVDNIRDLRGNATYRPARSRFKVYIIDEVHMLSTGAFNALLKTLEEPPDHVKFIMATTEIQKVPATIQSRVQRFDFRSIDVDTIEGQLSMICKAEEIEADEGTLRRVARLANGSMRDGLSLLDQLLSFGGDRLTAAVMDDVLPAAHDELIHELMDFVAAGDAAGALASVDRSMSAGATVDRFCEGLIDHLRSLMLLKVCGAETDLVDVPSQIRGLLITQSECFDASTYVYMITIAEELRRSARQSGAGRALADAAVVRLATAVNFTDVETLLAELRGEGRAVGGGLKKKLGGEDLGKSLKVQKSKSLNEVGGGEKSRNVEKATSRDGEGGASQSTWEGPAVRRNGGSDGERNSVESRGGVRKGPVEKAGGRVGEVVGGGRFGDRHPGGTRAPVGIERGETSGGMGSGAGGSVAGGSGAGGSGTGGSGAGGSEVGVFRVMNSAERAVVMRDPLVRKVIEAVDGRVVGMRLISAIEDRGQTGHRAGSADDVIDENGLGEDETDSSDRMGGAQNLEDGDD
jgi:DNA polymerase-3 subunit gamma/tau